MADDRELKKKALQQLSQDQGISDKIFDYLDRAGAATRSGIYEAQNFDLEDPMAPGRAFVDQLSRPSAEAPTGIDIAERTGLENPYALGAIATAADLTDPTPFGKLGKGVKALGAVAGLSRAPKAIKGMKAGERALSEVGGTQFPAESAAKYQQVKEALTNPKFQRIRETLGIETPKGTGGALGERLPIESRDIMTQFDSPVQLPSAKRASTVGEEFSSELGDILDQFPGVNPRKKLLLPKKPR